VALVAFPQVNVGLREVPVAPLFGKTNPGGGGGLPVVKDQVGEEVVPALFLATIIQ
jgi:hypothetical protein